MLVRLLRQLLPTEYNTLQYLSPCELLNGLSGAGALSTLLPSNCLLPYAAKHRTTKLPINHHRSSGWLASGAVAKLLRSALLGLHLSFRTPRPDLPTIAFVVKTNNATVTNVTSIVDLGLHMRTVSSGSGGTLSFGAVASLTLEDHMRPYSRRSS